MNHAQLVGAQDRKVIVPTYNWADYFHPFFKQTAFKGIKAMHHMRFSKSHHGKVYMNNSIDSQETLNILDGVQIKRSFLRLFLHLDLRKESIFLRRHASSVSTQLQQPLRGGVAINTYQFTLLFILCHAFSEKAIICTKSAKPKY